MTRVQSGLGCAGFAAFILSPLYALMIADGEIAFFLILASLISIGEYLMGYWLFDNGGVGCGKKS